MKKRMIVSAGLIIICLLSACNSYRENIEDTEPFSYELMKLGYDAQPFFEQNYNSFARTESIILMKVIKEEGVWNVLITLCILMLI